MLAGMGSLPANSAPSKPPLPIQSASATGGVPISSFIRAWSTRDFAKLANPPREFRSQLGPSRASPAEMRLTRGILGLGVDNGIPWCILVLVRMRRTRTTRAPALFYCLEGTPSRVFDHH